MAHKTQLPDQAQIPPTPLGEAASRRTFLKWSGAAGLAVVAAACSDDRSLVAPVESEGLIRLAGHGAGFDTVNLGSGEIAILNIALVLEMLEAEFYRQVVAHPTFNSNMFSNTERQIFRDLLAHEIVHVEFLKAALGNNAVGNVQFTFSGVDFRNRIGILRAARDAEELGVVAYNGALQYLETPAFALAGAKIASVEGRHVSAINHILMRDGISFAPRAFDGAAQPADVFNAARYSIVSGIMTNVVANQLPS